MFRSFSTALSALNAFSTGVDVVGNNLANLNTTGYKTSTVSFQDLVTQSMGANLGETQAGFGVGRPTTIREFSQGAIQSSGGPLDVAIQGDGFFVVRAEENSIVYTRDGHIKVDANGVLTTATGARIQGWMEVNGQLTTSGPPTDMTVPVGVVRPPAPTNSFSLDMNLDATAAEGTTVTKSLEVYDSLGAAHVITVTLTKGANAGEWDYSLTVPDADVETAIPPVEGPLTFGAARSALPAIGVAGTGGRGKVIGGSLESSTVDIAREFTNLIVLQRGYQANAKVVSTVDEMSQETLNLKR
jgi:flagellar hook protein FlgE